MFARGAPTRIRTSDHLLKRELLYQLSYRGNIKVILLRIGGKCNELREIYFVIASV
jgi:hypothetical protein